MIGLIPRSFIDEILNRTDIVEYIDSFVPLKKRGNSHVACCPFHNEKTPSFNVVPKNQYYHCFGCGNSGNAISFAMNHLHLSFSEAVETLAQRLGLQVPREGQSAKQQPSHSLYQFLNKVAQYYQLNLRRDGVEAINYLKNRGVNGEMARLFGLGYASSAWHTLEHQFKDHQHELIASGMLITKDNGKYYDRYRHRIMFPIHDRKGRIIGFGGRAIDNSQKPKYLNSPETAIFQKSRELYGLHQVLQQQQNISSLLIVEGYLDVIALAQHGILNAVATLGTATSTYHIQLLSKHTKMLFFCFDGDAAGRQAAWKALDSSLPHLNAGLDINFIFLPEGQDPDSLIREEGREKFLSRLTTATPLHRFFFNSLTEGEEHNSIAQKSQLVNKAKPYLAKMSDGPYKQLMVDELARLTHIESHRLWQLLMDKYAPITTEVKPAIDRTPTRTAIAILLQNPEILAACGQTIRVELLDTQHQRVLKTLMAQIYKTPTINTAALVEAWRESPVFEAIVSLAAWDHQVPESALRHEFIDIILFLVKQNRERAATQLMKKARTEGLSDLERLQLQEILKERHRVSE